MTTIRTADDAFALVPQICGFWPSAAIVLIGLDRQVHLRVDVPTYDDEHQATLAALIEPTMSARARQVLLLIFEPSTGVADEVASALRKDFKHFGIDATILHSNGFNYRLIDGLTPAWREHAEDLGAAA